MTVKKDKRLIEDYIPIQVISKEASREKSVRKGHISTLHLWWARRPLVACRAAVYSAMVPAVQFMPQNGPDVKRPSLCRANSAKFIERLCKYPGDPRVIKEAEQHILSAHAARLTEEIGKIVTVEDIIEGRAARPKILDMFAGGGAIPLEALRLGCDAYAIDLNPVAHIIELCSLVYPQKYGKPDKSVKGCAKDGTWSGLAEEVKYWGNVVLEQAQKEIGDLYPLIPASIQKKGKKKGETRLSEDDDSTFLMPIAYLWTRTVKCKRNECGATVPLVKQTWLCKKNGRYVAMKIVATKGEKTVKFEVIETEKEQDLGFDPTDFSSEGNASCPFCQTVADKEYVKNEGKSGRIGEQLMAIACVKKGSQGKVYLSAEEVKKFIPNFVEVNERIQQLNKKTGISVPDEMIVTDGKNSCWTHLYGLSKFRDLFNHRQMLCLLTFSSVIIDVEKELKLKKYDDERVKVIITYLGSILDRLADFNSSLCVFNYTGGRGVVHTFGRQALPMVWDYAESNPFNPDGASWISGIEDVPAGLRDATMELVANVERGSATSLVWKEKFFDAIITDPPYYDNVSYAVISDFFYIWLKRTIGHLYPEHFAAQGTPKKQEIVADSNRAGGSIEKARQAYEEMMAQSFKEAFRVLKPNGELVVVYAHKTTLGWATLIDALRKAGFTVSEAWPLDTEKPGRLRAQNSSALASSIFLVARKRDAQQIGNYENQVRPELEAIVKERVESLWDMGIGGGDLLISCVGAGMRAYTKFAKVEYANGAEVPAEHFLKEVESLVLENIIGQLAKITGGGKGRYSLSGIDAATRFYIFWRFTYRNLEMDAGEAIIFSYGAHVELDGADGLSAGACALVEKKKGKYKLRDFTERGNEENLGVPDEDGQSAPLIDMLHRMLWLMENHPADLPQFLQDTKANKEQLRLVAQMLAGTGLKGSEMSSVSPSAELSALSRLIANWKSVVDEAPLTAGQKQLDFWEKR